MNRLPVVVLHELGRHHGNDIVVLRFGDFRRLLAGAPMSEQEAGR